MGCDIHLFLEKKLYDGTWKSACDWSENVDYEDSSFGEFIPVETYRIRNYWIFAILAGVRNCYGLKPIKFPRGIPEDLSNALKNNFLEWGCDAHTPTHYTVQEIFDHYRKLNEKEERDVFGILVKKIVQEIYRKKYCCEKMSDLYKKHRVIMWFDN